MFSSNSFRVAGLAIMPVIHVKFRVICLVGLVLIFSDVLIRDRDFI